MLRPGETLDPGEFVAWTNARVGAKYQRLSDVMIMADFPRNVAGKTLKREIRARYTESTSI